MKICIDVFLFISCLWPACIIINEIFWYTLGPRACKNLMLSSKFLSTCVISACHSCSGFILTNQGTIQVVLTCTSVPCASPGGTWPAYPAWRSSPGGVLRGVGTNPAAPPPGPSECPHGHRALAAARSAATATLQNKTIVIQGGRPDQSCLPSQ